jgi:hypothetical protein
VCLNIFLLTDPRCNKRKKKDTRWNGQQPKLHQGQNLKECNLLKFLTKLSLIKSGVTYQKEIKVKLQP